MEKVEDVQETADVSGDTETLKKIVSKGNDRY